MDLLSDSIFIKNLIGTVTLGHTHTQVTEVYMGLDYQPDGHNTAVLRKNITNSLQSSLI